MALVRPALGARLFTRIGGGVAQSNTIGDPSLGRTFATPQAWINAAPSVIPYPGTPYTGQLYNDFPRTGYTYSSTGIVIAGIDTTAWDSTGQPAIKLTTAPGESFRDNANVRTVPLNGLSQSNGVLINIPLASLNGRGITVSVGNVAFSNLQITVGSANRGVNSDNGAPGPVMWTNCIIGAGAASDVVSGTGNVFDTCLLIQYVSIPSVDGSAAIFDGSLSVGGATFTSCTLVQPSDTSPSDFDIWNTVGESGHPTICTNMALFGATAIVQTGAPPVGATCTNCMSDAPSATGVIGGQTYVNQFVGTTGGAMDFRIKSGANLIGAGIVGGAGKFDISGFPRPSSGPWDVGCWQFG